MVGDESDPPGAVSNQNGEEAEAAHRADGEGAKPAAPVEDPDNAGAGGSGADAERSSSPGAAGEGSQATGHPANAG